MITHISRQTTLIQYVMKIIRINVFAQNIGNFDVFHAKDSDSGKIHCFKDQSLL